MRLIDADELLSKLNEAYKKANAGYHRRAFNGFWCGICSALQEVIREVKEQPTAYDVDKVVSEMEKDKFIDCETILSDIHQGYNAGLSRAIEIGKGGGVDG